MPNFRRTDIFTLIENVLIALFAIVMIVGITLRLINNYFRKTVTTKAKAVDKIATTYKIVSNNPTSGTDTDFVVVFDANGKIMRFKTSLWVYDSIKKGEIGTLKYKGSRLISFD